MGSMAVMGAAFISCSNENLYDENASTKDLEAAYTANFEKRYGKIDPNQTWDFTTDTPSYSAVSGSTTRAAASPETADFTCQLGHMDIQPDISTYIYQNLPKGQNNSSKGRKFQMVVGENDFTVVPLFQGCASYYWELWLTVDGVGEYKIWSKGEDLKYRTAGTSGEFKTVDIGKNGMDYSKEGPFEVYAPTYTFNNLPTGHAMYFSLRVWTSHDKFLAYEQNPLNEANHPIISSSVDSWMIDLQDAPVPDGLPEGYTATIIGCEDNQHGDNDFEDLVFMVYGKPVPPTKRVDRVIEQKSKRYIMEDLGETDDFDFNDVVFDIFYDRTEITYYYDSPQATVPYKTERNALNNLGVVRAAGGTLDFEIQIAGNGVWTKSSKVNKTNMINTQSGYNLYYVLDEFDATGYIASQNNVSVVVESRGNNEGVHTIPFPEAGVAPKIVAVPVTTKWMTERTKVPVDWFTPKTQSNNQ